MDEAQRLCDEIVIIDQGRILAHGTPAELIDAPRQGPRRSRCKSRCPTALANGRFEHEDIGDSVLFYVETPRELHRRRCREDAVYRHRQANLEDVFLRLTGRKLREA